MDSSDFVEATCEICGATFDFCLCGTNHEQAGLCECEKGHAFCAEHVADELKKKWEENEDVDYSDIKSEDCPICSKKEDKRFPQLFDRWWYVGIFAQKEQYDKERAETRNQI